MLSKKQRIQRSEFNKCVKKTTAHKGGFFLVKIHKNDQNKGAVIVSKKVAKSAVRRNYIRRVLYSVLRDVLSEQTYGYIFLYCLKDFETMEYKTIKEKIKTLLQTSLKG